MWQRATRNYKLLVFWGIGTVHKTHRSEVPFLVPPEVPEMNHFGYYAKKYSIMASWNHFTPTPQGATSPWIRKPATGRDQNTANGKTRRRQLRRKSRKENASKRSQKGKKHTVEGRQLGASSTTDLRETFNRCKINIKSIAISLLLVFLGCAHWKKLVSLEDIDVVLHFFLVQIVKRNFVLFWQYSFSHYRSWNVWSCPCLCSSLQLHL